MRTTRPSCRLVIDAPAQIFLPVTSSCSRMISRRQIGRNLVLRPIRQLGVDGR
jgi:hypothetical protein